MFGIEHTSPTQNIVIIDVETINSLIQGELLSPIYNLLMLKVICQQLFNRLVTSIFIYRVTNQATTQYTQSRPENNECHYITSP